MGDEFRPAMRKGWLAYIEKTYSGCADASESMLGQGELIVPDNE